MQKVQSDAGGGVAGVNPGCSRTRSQSPNTKYERPGRSDDVGELFRSEGSYQIVILPARDLVRRERNVQANILHVITSSWRLAMHIPSVTLPGLV